MIRRKTAIAEIDERTDGILIATPLQRQARQQELASHADDQADRLKVGFEAALASRRR